MELHLKDGRGKFNSLGGDVSFALSDGYTAIIGSEERRVYDRIIESHIGVIATTGLEGRYLVLCKAWLLVLIMR